MFRFIAIMSLSAMVLLMLLPIGCSKDEDSTLGPDHTSPAEQYLWVYGPADSARVLFSGLPTIDAGGLEAISLSAFVDTVLIPPFYDKDGTSYDARILYAYRIAADDGFCAHDKGYCDNIWEQMLLGYVQTETRRTIFPDDLIDLPGAYNIKETRHIHACRKVDVNTPDTMVFFELADLNVVSVTNFDGEAENAVALKDFITPLIPSPGDHEYNMRSLDDFGPATNLTWEQLQTGFWLLSTGKTIFTDPDLTTGAYKLKALREIIVCD